MDSRFLGQGFSSSYSSSGMKMSLKKDWAGMVPSNSLTYASVNSKHQHPPPRATPGVLHSTAAPGPGFILDDLPRGPGFCISIKLRLVQ